jgi:DUF1365 family protein
MAKLTLSIPALSTVFWLTAILTCLLLLVFVVLLPAYTLLLAAITIIRHHIQSSSKSIPWSNITTSIFRGSVFHIRHKPTVHSFSYPLFFSVVDLDEGNALFGDNVYNNNIRDEKPMKGKLWPLSTLMMLRDVDHLKNGEGLSGKKELSLKERIGNLIHERTQGKLDLRSILNDTINNDASSRKVVLVTHLMYYGYCFNPVSLYYVLKPTTTTAHNHNSDQQIEIEAIVVEVSNTPWNEMSIYVLHPDSVDVSECSVTPCADDASYAAPSYRYKFRKNFHVSPFMTMDHIYDWTFRMSLDRIQVTAKMMKQPQTKKDDETNDGELYFTAGFDITRTRTNKFFPFQLAAIICRFPIYCFIIQIWIHYEAVKLLMKGVQFIPHPKGSETAASRAIATVMGPVFLLKDCIETRWKRKRQ